MATSASCSTTTSSTRLTSAQDPTSIVAVEFEYVLGNDFKVQMWSDRQTGRRAMPAAPLSAETIDATEPALITLRRAEGNVKDISNLQLVKFDYGLPTGNLVGGFTVEGKGLWGFDFYGEWDRNKRYYQYPNAALFTAGKNHKISTEQSDAWFFNLSRQFHPWFFFGEVYAMDDAYSTTAFLVDANGDIQYDNSQRNFYEFVEDNDDQDQYPDWIRAGSANDRLIFPGWTKTTTLSRISTKTTMARSTTSFPTTKSLFCAMRLIGPNTSSAST